MIAIAIDDEPKALEGLALQVSKIPFIKLEETFISAFQAAAYLQDKSVDLVFLDIQMPDISGLEWLKSLSQPPSVIFTTAYSEYAVESYELEAIDYLVKPIGFNRLLKAVNRAAKAIKKEKADHIFIKSGYDIVRIDFSKLCFVEGASNYVYFHTTEKKWSARMSLRDAIDILPDYFVRIHRSFIVNIRLIDRIAANHVYIGEQILTIGREWREELLKTIDQKGKV